MSGAHRFSVSSYLSLGTILVLGCGGAAPPAPSAPEIRIAVPSPGAGALISRAFYQWKDKWEAETGAKLTLVEIPSADLPQRVALAFASEEGKLDGAVVPAEADGDLISAVARIDELRQSKDFPSWSEQTVPSALSPLLHWGDSWTSCPLTADAVLLYSRKDILGDPKHKEAFEKKTGQPLKEPQTWDECEKICEYFASIDWNGNGKADEHGVSLHLAPGSAGLHFLALSAAYVVQPGPKDSLGANVYYFEPESMKPLVDSAGHAKGLDVLRKLAKYGDSKQTTWRPQDAWADFLAGKSLFCFTTPDLGRLAQDPSASAVKGKLGCQVLPGGKELWSFKDKRFKSLSQPNVVANTLGANWHGVVAKKSPNPGLVYHLFAFQANRLVNSANVLDNRSGVHLGRSYQFIPPHGEGVVADYEKGGFDPSDLKEISGATYENYFRAPATLEHLRLPGASKFQEALEESITEALANPSIPSETILQSTAERFRKIIREIEVKVGEGRLKDFYRQSLGLKPRTP
jgi:multiple sugar transport system substrate-binding protein